MNKTVAAAVVLLLLSVSAAASPPDSREKRALAIVERIPPGAKVPPVRGDFAALLRAASRDSEALAVEGGG